MANNVEPIPEGYHAITPSLVIKDGARAIDFYKKALDAKELYRMDAPDGAFVHAELKIGDSIVMLGYEPGDGSHMGHDEYCAKSPLELKANTGTLYLYVENSDLVYERALAAGAEKASPMTDMFWGDRVGNIRDPFGYLWTIATRKEILTPEQMAARGREFFAKAGAR